jgi:hypothetical protein
VAVEPGQRRHDELGAHLERHHPEHARHERDVRPAMRKAGASGPIRPPVGAFWWWFWVRRDQLPAGDGRDRKLEPFYDKHLAGQQAEPILQNVKPVIAGLI